MDREKVLKLSIAVRINRHFTMSDIITLLTSYCVEHGKDPNKTREFIHILLRINEVQRYFLYALNMYEKKFNIVMIKDNKNNILKIF